MRKISDDGIPSSANAAEPELIALDASIREFRGSEEMSMSIDISNNQLEQSLRTLSQTYRLATTSDGKSIILSKTTEQASNTISLEFNWRQEMNKFRDRKRETFEMLYHHLIEYETSLKLLANKSFKSFLAPVPENVYVPGMEAAMISTARYFSIDARKVYDGLIRLDKTSNTADVKYSACDRYMAAIVVSEKDSNVFCNPESILRYMMISHGEGNRGRKICLCCGKGGHYWCAH